MRYRCRCPEAQAAYKIPRKVRSRSFGKLGPGRHARHRDVDPLAVELVCRERPAPTPLGHTEREQAVRLLTTAGLSSTAIARRIGLAPRSVQRIRSRLRQRQQEVQECPTPAH